MNKDLKNIYNPRFAFDYEGETYELINYRIFNIHDEEICTVDLTTTAYSSDKLLYSIICKIALAAYYKGIKASEQAMHKSIKDLLEV